MSRHIKAFIAPGILGSKDAVFALKWAVSDIHVALRKEVFAAPSIRTFDGLPFEDPTPAFEVESHYFARLKAFHFDKEPHGPHEVCLYLLPPQHTVDGTPHLIGGAQGVCIKGPTMCFVTVELNTWMNRTKARYAIEHELLHILGANHISGRNVMVPGNFRYISPAFPTLEILHETVSEVKACGL